MQYKGCARCTGDLYIEDDLGFTDLVCLQCGYRASLGAAAITETAEEDARLVRWLHSAKVAA